MRQPVSDVNYHRTKMRYPYWIKNPDNLGPASISEWKSQMV